VAKKTIKIDEGKCIGCGLCVSACKEAAIGLVDGKARLLRKDHCDGLGRCLPVCPENAISFEDREIQTPHAKLGGGCPIANSKTIERKNPDQETLQKATSAQIHLNQWPVQIKLVTINAPYFENAHLLIAADCTAYAYSNFHAEYMRNRITIIGCPKLDEGDYSEKLSAILSENAIKSVTIARMEVPCCSGIENAAKIALQNCGKMIPWQIVTISTDGRVLDI